MSLAKDMIKEYFISQGVTPEEVSENVLNMTCDLQGGKADIYLSVEQDKYVKVLLNNFCFVPEEKKQEMCVLLNDINSKYRFAKFYVEDNAICVDSDIIVTLDSCAEIVSEYVFRLVNILEDNYKDIMKGIWA